MNQVYEVEIIRDRDAQKHSMHEYYVASHISKVIDKLKIELMDDGAEVALIRAVVPVLAILD